MNPSEHPPVAVVGLYAAVWAAFGVVSGWAAAHVPRERFATAGLLTRIRAWERSGRAYERIRIRRWKDRLPEAGATFAGGTSKRSLRGTSPEALAELAAETRRAEVVHWAQVVFAFTFVLWNPVLVAVAMVVFASAVHLPFVAVQRFNRGRIERILARPSAARRVDAPRQREHDGVVDDPRSTDEQEGAELLDEERLGDEDLQIDGLRAHDLDLVDSVRDRAVREEPDFDRRRPRGDHTAAQLVAPTSEPEPAADVFGDEVPGDDPGTAEENAMHLEDEAGRAI